jgi:hypothetical protein
MGQPARVFFEATQSVTFRMGELFNFAFSTAAALWNLRQQVQEFIETTGITDQYRLHDRFVAGSGVTSADLITSCIRMSWSQQQEQFAKFLLFELCALYEGWLDDVVPRCVSSRHVEQVEKDLQFPNRLGGRRSFPNGLRIVNASRSRVMKDEFLPFLKAHPKNSWNHLDELLKAYRYFKEVRNAIIHSGGRASPQVISSLNDLIAVPFADLGLKEPFSLRVPVRGQQVAVGFRNVTGLANVIHRLIVTFDAALAVSRGAEGDLLQRFAEANTNPHALSKKDPKRRQKGLLRMLGKGRLPRPPITLQLEALLLSRGLVF